jgi:very-short-patch-repair endonuclease
MPRHQIPAPKRALAKALRHRQTTIEELVWRELRAKRFDGAKFRRQVPLGPYIVDFVCFAARLIVEVDGPDHAKPSRIGLDQDRDAWFAARGFCVARITGEEVIGGLDLALARVKRLLDARQPSCPPPRS